MDTKSSNYFLLLCFSLCLISTILETSQANDQTTLLYRLLKSKRSKNPSLATSWTKFPNQLKDIKVHVGPQNGLMNADKISSLPGQPERVDFNQYSGYVTVDQSTGKALFYYFAESPQDSSTKPLVLWLNGGPGCSSFGNGGLLELGPFRVKSDGKTLFQNKYSWIDVANVIFLESPAGVGFSYANDTKVYDNIGDISTAKDTYIFLINWLERFPQYKNREFYLTGESYAGHYVPQLAETILQNNKNAAHNIIQLKGIAIGNAWIDDATNTAGMYDFFWNRDMISDDTHAKIHKFCDFSNATTSDECNDATERAGDERGSIDVYNIYAHLCQNSGQNQTHINDSVESFDPCSSGYVDTYLNIAEVQKSLHAKSTNWASCSSVIFGWKDSPSTILPIIQKLIASNIRVWIYSGDVDGRVPVTSSKYSINTLKLPIKTPWRPWSTKEQVGGYVVEHKGLVFVTVRGAGHLVPSYQPERALTMISSFLKGTLPPK